MKTMKRTALALVLTSALVTAAVAGSAAVTVSPNAYDRAEQNLLLALQSNNAGLRESAAFMLGELQSDRAVIPLLRILKDDPRESTRMVAALALCRIGDARGVFAVKRATTFDGSQDVRYRCAWFYEQFVQPGSYDFGGGSGSELALR